MHKNFYFLFSIFPLLLLSGCAQPRPVVRRALTTPIPVKYPAAGRTISRVIIDPGHGGSDPGAVGKGIYEKRIVLDIAKRLKRRLQSQGIAAELTRDRDIFISLWKRSHIANTGAADFFISIHGNAHNKRGAHGIETFYVSDSVNNIKRAAEMSAAAKPEVGKNSVGNAPGYLNAMLWDLILRENRAQSQELAGDICKELAGRLNVKNRGVKPARFYVLKKTRIPAVLVEVGFVTNGREAANLKIPDYRERIALALSQGIFNFKKKFDATNGFAE